MNLRLPLYLAAAYRSASQQVRIMTERWVGDNLFCPECSEEISKVPNNQRVLDFVCRRCGLTFELKSKKGPFGRKLVDGAYQSMISALNHNTHPNFLLLSYTSDLYVENLLLIPKRFIIPELIEKRKPLGKYAQRAGWIGCNLRVSPLPEEAKIYYIKDSKISQKQSVCSSWQQTQFLDGMKINTKNWLILVMGCIERMRKPVFVLDELYQYVPELQKLFPNNKHIKEKIRQQLQILRNKGWLIFYGNGKYKITRPM